MRKFVALGLAVATLMSMTTVVFADTTIEVNTTQSAETVVKYGLDSSYTVVIPAEVVIDTETRTGETSLSASNVLINFGETLNVAVTGDEIWKLVDTANGAGENKIEYFIGTTAGGKDVLKDTIVLSSEAGANWNDTKTEELFFTIEEDIEKTGQYEDTLTFTVSID